MVISHSSGFNTVKRNKSLTTGTKRMIKSKTNDDNCASHKDLLCPFPFVNIESVLERWLNAWSIWEIANTQNAIV